MMAWSTVPGEAYLTREGIRKIKSQLTNQIFKQEMLHTYEQKSQSRDELVREARRAIRRLTREMAQSNTFATHALASGVDAKTLSGILGHTNASFTLDTYTHTTGDMQKRAAEIVGGFLADYLGEEMAPWQNVENTAMAASA